MWANLRWVMEGVRQMALCGDWAGFVFNTFVIAFFFFGKLLSLVLTLGNIEG